MLRSALFAPVRRDRREDESSLSGRYLERMGYIAPFGAGFMNHLPLGHGLFNNVKSVLNGHLSQLVACSFFEAVAIQPSKVWADSGRLEMFGSSIFRFPDRHGREIVLAPTHEVTAAALGARYLKSYRDLPVRISQIQIKFRDEERPRAGVIRTRQFQMHDLYAFDRDLESAQAGYATVREAYLKTFFDLRLPVIPSVQTDMGAIGGDRSEEFLMPCAMGDDRWTDEEGAVLNCLELAHIFMLGTAYSEAANARFIDSSGTERPIYMSSFGLGIERAAAAYIERYAKPDSDVEVSWSWALSPYQVLLLTDGPVMRDVYRNLVAQGLRVLLDDRDIPFRKKLGEGRKMGFPIEILQSDRLGARELEIRCHRTGQTERIDVGELEEAMIGLRRRLDAIEIAERFGQVLSVDDPKRTMVVQFERAWQIAQAGLEQRQVPLDLLGRFGRRKRWGEPRPFAGEYSTTVIVRERVAHPTPRLRGEIPYLAWPQGSPFDLASAQEVLSGDTTSDDETTDHPPTGGRSPGM